MCAPFVMSRVREGFSRRGFIGAAAGCAASPPSMPSNSRAAAERVSRRHRSDAPIFPLAAGVSRLQTSADSRAIFGGAGWVCRE